MTVEVAARADARGGGEPAIGVRGGRGAGWPAVAAVGALMLAVLAQTRSDVHPEAWIDVALFFGTAVVLWVVALRAEREDLWEGGLTAVAGPALARRRRELLAGSLLLLAIPMLLAPWLAGVGTHGADAPAVPGEGPGLVGGLAILHYPDRAGTNHLTLGGRVLWLAGLAMYVAAVARKPERPSWPVRVRESWVVGRVSRTSLAVIGIMAVAAAFRLHDLAGLPLEMTSDHTEKLKDVTSILEGLRPVFLPGNAGREAIQFYWTALLVGAGLPLGFQSLKLGMAIVSVATVPVVYVLGRQTAGREAGLWAAMVLALAPWHIQITRIGLRIALSPFFAALATVLLFRALRSGRRNDWLWAGGVAALGLYGYTGYRPMGLVLLAVVGLRIAYAWRAAGRPAGSTARELTGHAAAALGLGVIVVAPLVRYAADAPNAFLGRTLSRVTGSEQAIQGSLTSVLVANWRDALLMFNRTSDAAWFQSPSGRPALETVGGALIVLGAVTALHRAARGDWRSAALLVAIPVMLSSTALSLAFPVENPSLSRAAGAIPFVVVVAALPVAVVGRRMRSAGGDVGVAAFLVLAAALFVAMARTTAERYFVEYRDLYDRSTHNTTEYARVLATFLALGGDMEHAYLVGWAHGPDYRAIGELAGDLGWDGLLWGAAPDGSDAVEQVRAAGHAADPARKLYLVGGPLAESNVDFLTTLYPDAMVTRHRARVDATKDFFSVLVPDRDTS